MLSSLLSVGGNNAATEKIIGLQLIDVQINEYRSDCEFNTENLKSSEILITFLKNRKFTLNSIDTFII